MLLPLVLPIRLPSLLEIPTHLAAVDALVDPTRLGHAQDGGVDIFGFGRQDRGPDFPERCR